MFSRQSSGGLIVSADSSSISSRVSNSGGNETKGGEGFCLFHILHELGAASFGVEELCAFLEFDGEESHGCCIVVIVDMEG